MTEREELLPCEMYSVKDRLPPVDTKCIVAIDDPIYRAYAFAIYDEAGWSRLDVEAGDIEPTHFRPVVKAREPLPIVAHPTPPADASLVELVARLENQIHIRSSCGRETESTTNEVRIMRDCLAALQSREALIGEMWEAMQDFVDKVDRGEARSRKTYGRFKAILARLPDKDGDGE
ncbi:MAG: hypothetical protein AAGE05_04310 [Pseudomonadota bacterium]